MFIAWFHDFTNLRIYGNNFVLTMLSVVSKENTELDNEQEEFLELHMWLIYFFFLYFLCICDCINSKGQYCGLTVEN